MNLKFAFQEFISDREYKELSARSINNYEQTFKQFFAYCVEQEIVNTDDVTASIIKNFLITCQRNGNNAGSINFKLRNLKAIFSFFLEQEIIKENPAKKVPFVKNNPTIQVFKDEHIDQMLKYYRRLRMREHDFHAVRDSTIINVLISTGLRLGELCSMKWSKVDLVNQEMVIFGKARTDVTIEIADSLKSDLDQYKLTCMQQFKKNLPEYVFVNLQGKRLTENAVKCIFKRLSKVMSFKDVRLSAHSFRHYYCSKMVQNMNAFEVQDLMRHKSVSTTQRYVHLFRNDLKEKNNKFNPLNQFK